MTDNFQHHPDYQNIPECIKSNISPKEYAWLPDELKRSLERDMTTPEVVED